MSNEKYVKPEEVIWRNDGGGYYMISGDLVNGGSRDPETGEWKPFIHHHDITRKINSVNFEKGMLYCECGREFIINDNLKLIKCDY